MLVNSTMIGMGTLYRNTKFACKHRKKKEKKNGDFMENDGFVRNEKKKTLIAERPVVMNWQKDVVNHVRVRCTKRKFKKKCRRSTTNCNSVHTKIL